MRNFPEFELLIRVIKSGRMHWSGNVARMKKMINLSTEF
jgi:hypothetical protein